MHYDVNFRRQRYSYLQLVHAVENRYLPAVHSLINLILIFGRFDRLTSLTGLTKYNLLAPLCLPSPVSPAEHSIQGVCSAGETGEWGRGADTAVFPTAAAASITAI